MAQRISRSVRAEQQAFSVHTMQDPVNCVPNTFHSHRSQTFELSLEAECERCMLRRSIEQKNRPVRSIEFCSAACTGSQCEPNDSPGVFVCIMQSGIQSFTRTYRYKGKLTLFVFHSFNISKGPSSSRAPCKAFQAVSGISESFNACQGKNFIVFHSKVNSLSR